jgi:hypothetical protein
MGSISLVGRCMAISVRGAVADVITPPHELVKVYRHQMVSCVRFLGWVVFSTLSMFRGVSATDPPAFGQVIRSSDVATMTEWAKRYERGIGVSRNIDRAIQLYCKAARKGDAQAQYNLGWIYALGRAGKGNDVLAAGWLTRAADQDHRQAQTMLESLGSDGIRRRGKAKCVLSKDLSVQTLGTRSVGSPMRFPAKHRRNTNRRQVADLVSRLAPQYGLNAKLVLSVIEVESGFNFRALSPKNAQGLMQLMPATAARFGVRDVWDPEQNLRGGMAYLSWLMKHFKGNVRLALAAYNAGEQAVKRHGGIPPFEETRKYVRRITQNIQNKGGGSVVAPQSLLPRASVYPKGMGLATR